jgi:hypothetical protein
MLFLFNYTNNKKKRRTKRYVLDIVNEYFLETVTIKIPTIKSLLGKKIGIMGL